MSSQNKILFYLDDCLVLSRSEEAAMSQTRLSLGFAVNWEGSSDSYQPAGAVPRFDPRLEVYGSNTLGAPRRNPCYAQGVPSQQDGYSAEESCNAPARQDGICPLRGTAWPPLLGLQSCYSSVKINPVRGKRRLMGGPSICKGGPRPLEGARDPRQRCPFGALSLLM